MTPQQYETAERALTQLRPYAEFSVRAFPEFVTNVDAFSLYGPVRHLMPQLQAAGFVLELAGHDDRGEEEDHLLLRAHRAPKRQGR